MQLSYRGAIYQNDLPTVEMTEGEIGGKYRGQAWNYRYARHIPVPQPTPQLKYRGASYCKDSRANAEACFAAPSAEETPARVVPSCGRGHKVIDDLEEIHLANIRRRLEYRLEVAKNRGDRDLLRMLEAECHQLVGNCG